MIFEDADSIPTLDEIARELVQGLPDVLSPRDTKYRLWTKEVCRRLCDMGNERKLLVCCHGSRDNGEWLLDVVWFASNRHEIVLAVESEWGMPGDVQDDFDKLMSIKAQRKLLIFNAIGQFQSNQVVERLEGSMRAYPLHLEGEEYMALDMRAEGTFGYRFKVPKNGRLESVSFTRIEEPLQWPWPRVGWHNEA
jgi:hypothetical protein